MKNTDRIEREVEIAAPRGKVWRVLTDATEFGAWFGVKLAGVFAGRVLRGAITIPGYEHVTMEITVERMDPETLVSWRWHPAAVEPGVDYSHEPKTLVEFTLEEIPKGTRLRVVESGFERVPAARRAEAFRMNSHGWEMQMEAVRRYVER
jgi:uncharacterized protein YndB with AHSA1/START domain